MKKDCPQCAQNVRCFKCQREGHYAKDYPIKEDQ